MDQQLKQRLIGATIIVSLVVIFVPMLFEDRPGDQSAAGAGDIPALPREIEEKSIELPKSASEAAPLEGEDSSNTSYRIVPLTDGESPTAANEQTPSADAGGMSENRAASAADGDPTAGGEDVPKNAGDEQIRPAADSDSPQALKIDEPAKTEAVNKSKPAPAKKSKLEPSALAVHSEEEVAIESTAPESTKAKAKAAPAKPAEKGPKKPEAARAAETGASARSAPLSPVPQKPAPIRSPSDNPKAVQPARERTVPQPANRTPEPRDLSSSSGPSGHSLPEGEGNNKARASAAGAGGGSKAPEPPESRSEESDDLAAWVVQTGSFTAEGNARSLADRLRKSNFPAFVEVVTNGGTSVYRVQVGPELNRPRAEQMQQQIENTVGVKGIVVPHP